jgi:hypothetical protein
MTPLDLTALKAAEKAATPGPWWTMPIEGAAAFNEWSATIIAAPGSVVVADSSPSNGEYIVAAVNAIPALIAVAEAAREFTDLMGPQRHLAPPFYDLYEALVAALATLTPSGEGT